MQLTPENFKVSRLLKEIEDGVIALPEFQRDFVWKPPLVADMLRTLLRQWPPGTFLLLEVDGEPEFAIKPLAEAPPLATAKLLILDGQQRSTAIYQALRERAGETYYVKIGDVAESGVFDDDDLEYLKNEKFMKKYKNLKQAAAAGVVRVSTLWNDSEWQKWLRELPEETQDRMVDVRSSLLPGSSDFEIPSVRLESGAELPAIAKIFETLNRRGVRLATFDLMVARLYSHGFYLRDQWDDARAEHDEFDQFAVDGVEILKAIALREHIRQKDAGVKRTVKGIRESDVLALAAETVVAQWDNAIAATLAAIRFVAEDCGAIRSGLIPSTTMLHPIAFVLAPDRGQRDGMREDVRRWFWATAFTQTYAQGANTRAVTDAQALQAWQADRHAEPDVIRNFRFDADLLGDGRARNEMLVRGILCQSIINNARDWCQDKRFIDVADKLEVHHVFPEEFLKKHYRREKDPVVNFVMLTESCNKKLRNTLPKDVLARPDVHNDAIATHRIDLASLEESADDGGDPEKTIQRFLGARAATLLPMVYQTVGVTMPTAEEAEA